MVFFKFTGRKNNGKTGAKIKMFCYKCNKEIKMGQVFYSKARHTKNCCRVTGHLCEPCYQGLFINI